VRRLAALSPEENGVVPCSPGGFEPLHAIYSKRILPLLEQALTSDRKRIIDLLELMEAKIIPAEEIATVSPGFRSFVNLNSPEDCSYLL
jgi:molybdopterin-guanine dinucleotide biosynthesis protein A